MKDHRINKIAILFLAFALTLLTSTASAQSKMTDNQVAEYIQRQVKVGTSQSQIVTHLMQNGVDISQIRRVRSQLEKQMSGTTMGAVNTSGNNGSRMRSSNAVTAKRNASTTGLIQAQENENTTNGYDQEDVLMNMNDSSVNARPQYNNYYKGKKVFGRDIFSNKNLSFDPIMNIATPQNYVLGPGDAVSVDIYGASQRTADCTVSPDGDIVIEGYGPVHVGGLTVAAAKARLRSTLGSRYQSSRIKLSLGQTRTVSINIMGEVNNPGTYTMSAFASVFNALYMAGGTNEIGTLRNIKIYRHGRLVSVCDIYDYILNGKMTGNIRLQDGDVIIVGPYDCLVDIEGKVKRPMYYEMKRNESVETLLRYAGGFTGDAYKKAVRIMRKTGREYAVYNVEEFDMSSFRIADGDSVSVDSILPRYQNTVEVKGAVFRPGMYQLGDGINSVRTLVQRAEGLTEDAFTARAVMHRMKPDRTLRVISVDIKGIMDGTVADIPLQENDVLFIPTKQTAMTKQTVTIMGEVQYPGVYQYADNETLEDLVLQAGGLNETASTVKVDVSRRVGNPKALTTDSIISQNFTFSLKDGFVVDGQPGFTLMPFDEVFVRRAHVVGNHAAGLQEVLRSELRSTGPGGAKIVDRLHDRGEDLGVVNGRRAGHHANRALNAHPRVDVVTPQRNELALFVLVVLHEDVVPDLDVLAAVAARTAIGTALLLAGVDEHLGVRTARTRRPGRPPPVVLARQAEDALVGKPERLPDRDGLLVGRDVALIALLALAAEDRHVELLRLEAEVLRQKLKAPADRLLLEVVVQRPVAEHFEEGEVRRVADRVDVARPDALLHVREARPRWMRHLPHQVRHERVHARRREEHGRVVLGNHARAGNARVPLRLKEALIHLAKFICRQLLHFFSPLPFSKFVSDIQIRFRQQAHNKKFHLQPGTLNLLIAHANAPSCPLSKGTDSRRDTSTNSG